jgi:hypothetical protein
VLVLYSVVVALDVAVANCVVVLLVVLKVVVVV